MIFSRNCLSSHLLDGTAPPRLLLKHKLFRFLLMSRLNCTKTLIPSGHKKETNVTRRIVELILRRFKETPEIVRSWETSSQLHKQIVLTRLTT